MFDMEELGSVESEHNGNPLTSFSVTFTDKLANRIGFSDYEGTAIDLASLIALLRDEVAAKPRETEV